MSDSFCPKNLGFNTDPRELGLMVSHLFVIEESLVGTLPADAVLTAAPLPVVSTKAPASRGAAGKAPAAVAKPKPTPKPKAH